MSAWSLWRSTDGASLTTSCSWRATTSCARCRDFGAALVDCNGQDDHVHLLVDYPPTVQLSKLVNSLKGVCARVLRRDFRQKIRPFLRGEHFWSPSYFGASVGGALTSVVRVHRVPTTSGVVTNQRLSLTALKDRESRRAVEIAGESRSNATDNLPACSRTCSGD